MAWRNSGMPIMEGYWLYPSSTASAAARRMSSGPGSSGNPWRRLMALLSRASCDIASKIVTGRSAKTLFIDVMERSAAGLGRQTCSLPGQHAAGEMLVVGEPIGLRRKRGGHRALPGAAREHHRPAARVRNVVRVERGERDHGRVRIGLHRDFVRLADIDQQISPFRDSLRHVGRRQIVNLMIPHSISPNGAD